MTELDDALIAWAHRRRDDIAGAAGGHGKRAVEAALIVGLEAGLRLGIETRAPAQLIVEAIERDPAFRHPEIIEARASVAELVKATR